MGNAESRPDFKQAVIELTSKDSTASLAFWDQFWVSANAQTPKDVFALITPNQIAELKSQSPTNLATLIHRAVDCLRNARDASVPSTDHKKVLNCVRLLTRLVPFLFEDSEWRELFWSPLPSEDIPLASVLLGILSDLLFCPDFTVSPFSNRPDGPQTLDGLDSCEFIWQAGVGFANKTTINSVHDSNRTEILRLLLALFSEVIYIPVTDESRMRWVSRFSSAENRHVLPLFTSLLNIVCSYDPVGYGLPYNYLLVGDSREPLVQTALHVLIVCLDRDSQPSNDETGYVENFFVNYLSRLHRENDFEFILKGISRLLNNPLQSSYLPNSTKKVGFHQELLVLLWKCCEYNQKFMFYVLKTSDVLEVLVPILYHLHDSRSDPSRVGLIHMGVFLILLLSGERNFGVRLNKPFSSRGVINLPMFTGTHADLLIIVFHKLITTGNHKLQSLFDCLLTIIVNISPYLKTLSMTTANKLVHLVEAFGTPWFLFSSKTNHHLIFFLLEVFNNIIQYQFDGNANLIYTIIRKRQVFYQLANLSSDPTSIQQSLKGRRGKVSDTEKEKEKSSPQTLEEKPTLQSTLAATPEISVMTDKGVGIDAEKEKTEEEWRPTSEWVEGWKSKLPLQTIMRVLQVLVPQVEKICIDKGLTDESEIIKFLQHGTLVGLLPVPHPILIRKYQSNSGTNHWFRTYMWGIIYLRNVDPPIWYDTSVNLFEIQKVN
ncbi:unnamed protein product [Bursaphelenchus xylophilus]|uniref:(pine wood nematode) hypothetical protein n=1 Tax=Bursaphelenchus xylophilus TaxID=6326 RepID=A0A1I7S6A0_BURXY|nr:unnamed protein product [Bursaphelenchus xylophilus]CAG9108861.1 unnamed protein product [Bursaphelenchus xylophilus]